MPPMDAAAWAVLLGGAALIALVLWYFFGERDAVRARPAAGGVQEVAVTVKGGYAPDVIVEPR